MICLGVLALLIVVLAYPERVVAQNYNDTKFNNPAIDRLNPNKDIIGLPPQSGTVDNNATQTEDTTKRKPRIRKPLESFYFNDSMRAERIFAWNVTLRDNDVHRVMVDTLLDDFQVDYIQMRDGVGSAYLGNIGSASIPLNYFKRPSYKNFSFVQVWDPFILTPERVMFYNAKMPYSRLSYSMSGQRRIEENLFDFVLSHNISPSTSASVVYHADGTRGMYNRQRTLDRYFALNLAHTGKRYAIHGGYIYNMGNVDENGGITDDREVTDTVIDVTQNIIVNLKAANNTYKGHTYYWTQSYGIPLRKLRDDELTIGKVPTIFIGQAFEYTLFKKKYVDSGDAEFFPNNFVNKTATADSMAQGMLDVKLFAQLQPYNRDGVLGLVTGGIGYQSNLFYHTGPAGLKDANLNPGNAGEIQALIDQWGAGGNKRENSTYVYGSVEGSASKYMKWNASAEYYLFGYRSMDFDASAMLSLSAYVKGKPLTFEAKARFALREPDFWAQNFFSNHYAWSNSFSKESITQIGAKFLIPSVGLELGGDYALTVNKVYYDANSLPSQFTGGLSVFGAYLQKDFRIGGFQLNHRVLMQWSSDQKVAPVPMLSAFLSYSFQFNVVKNVLRMEVGVDARYNTKYYGFGYNPAISQFYNQREKKIGGYPYLDAFVAMKWKRMRILGKLQHWNANLFGDQQYFMVAHYPANRLMFKLGISWSFYD